MYPLFRPKLLDQEGCSGNHHLHIIYLIVYYFAILMIDSYLLGAFLEEESRYE